MPYLMSILDELIFRERLDRNKPPGSYDIVNQLVKRPVGVENVQASSVADPAFYFEVVEHDNNHDFASNGTVSSRTQHAFAEEGFRADGAWTLNPLNDGL
ncbi:uncharacterized protein LTR77_004351 [Saxophila tyrrhenica]|uniref:Uncharacterized protein n=1 Tax=Saxophila tyrrhenica TaxID=1690608 RepID=A0AAV9PFV8_9PEZI|nr:hypothetical protein LTR77_004351 [Saxophila tyrrhenica]